MASPSFKQTRRPLANPKAAIDDWLNRIDGFTAAVGQQGDGVSLDLLTIACCAGIARDAHPQNRHGADVPRHGELDRIFGFTDCLRCRRTDTPSRGGLPIEATLRQ